MIAAYVAGPPLSGDVALGQRRVDGDDAPPRAYASWFGTNGITPDGPRFHFVVNNAADSILRPHEPPEGELVSVVVSPALARAAGPSGIVPLHVENR